MSIENGEIDLLHDIRVAAATLITLRDDCVGDGTTKGRMAAMELHAQRINAALQALRGLGYGGGHENADVLVLADYRE